MATYNQATIECVAQALCRKHFLTPREIQMRIELHYHRGTIRGALAQLVQDGAAEVLGDIYQKRYRRRDEAPE